MNKWGREIGSDGVDEKPHSSAGLLADSHYAEFYAFPMHPAIQSSRELWKCDYPLWRGTTVIELAQDLQIWSQIFPLLKIHQHFPFPKEKKKPKFLHGASKD